MDAGGTLVLCLLGGVLAGVLWPVNPWDAVAAAVAGGALAVLVEGRRWSTPFMATALCAGAVAHGAFARDRAISPPLARWFDSKADDSGRVEEAVLVDGLLDGDAASTNDGAQADVRVIRVRDATGWHPAPGRLQVHVAGALVASRINEWRAGRRVTAPMLIRRPAFVANFGGPSIEWQRLRRSFDLVATVKSAALVEVVRGAWWDEAAAAVRGHVRRAVTLFIVPRSARAAALVTAILIGDRAGLDDDVRQRLQAAGTYHVIAISGGNVALILGLSFALLSLLFRSPRLTAFGALVVAVGYGWVVGGDPSVSRAVVAAVVYLGASLAGLAPAPLAVLRVTAGLLVVTNPLIVIDTGAWLSFGATLGIIVLAPRLMPSANRITAPVVVRAVVRAATVLTVATLAAELTLTPIAASVFSRVGVAGLALNLVAIPAMAVTQVAGVVTVILSAWWRSGAAWSAGAARWAADALVESSRLVDLLPWLSWRVPPPPLAWTVLYYGAGITAVATAVPRRRWVAAGAAGIALLSIVTAPGLSRARPLPGRLRVVVLDVGQGDAILVQFPTGQHLLVDAGGGPGTFDVGARIVMPAVWSLGTRRLDWLAITHGDRDHIGGAGSVQRDLRPREIWEGIAVPRDPARAALEAAARRQGSAWRTTRSGARVQVGDVRVDVLHPPDPDWERQQTRNDDSVVLRLTYGAVEVVLTGDAGAEFEAQLPGDLVTAPVRILKVGHHGSRSSTSDRLVAALRPQAAIISAGRGNLFGHPALEIIQRLALAGADVFRTDRDGAVIVETDGGVARIRTALGRSVTIVAARPPSP